MTVQKLLTIFNNSYMKTRLKPTTISGYMVNINNHLLPYIGGIEVNDLTYEDLDTLVGTLNDKGLSNTSIRYVLATLRSALSFAVKRRYAEYNIVKSFDLPCRKRVKHFTYSASQINTLLEYLKETESDLFFAVWLASHFGLRRGECLGLKISDIDFETFHICRSVGYVHKQLITTDCKTENSDRHILFDKSFTEAFDFYNNSRKPNDEGYITRNKNGTVITPSSFDKRFAKVLKKLGLPCIRFHDLRHTFATLMMANNVNPKIVSSILGHSDVSVTLGLYSHTNVHMQSACLACIDRLFKEKTP